MVDLMPREALLGLVAGLDPVDHATHRVALTVETRAIQNLAAAHHHTRIVPHSEDDTEPARIELTKGGGEHPVSSYNVTLIATNAVALEYGHAPSGHFDPETFGRVTKAPHGQYILTRAAGDGGLALTPASGRKRGKR